MSALAMCVASAVWTLAGPSPAAAYVCEAGIDPVGTPPTPGVRLTGRFAVSGSPGDRSIDVSFPEAPPGAAPQAGGRAFPSDDRYEVTLAQLSRNGRYTARLAFNHPVTVVGCDGAVLGGDIVVVKNVTFSVSVRATPPVNVRARFDPGPRHAVVTWERSGDPDIAGYTVSRTVGSGEPTGVQVPASALSWTDTGLPAAGGRVTYSVAASRNGPFPNTTSVPSASVAAAPLDVPAQAGPATTAPATTAARTGATSRPGDPTTTITTAPFVLDPPVSASPLPTLLPGLGTPDPGFEEGAEPFPPPDALDQPVVGGGDGTGGGDGGGVGPLAYGTAGALGAAVAAALLWRRRRGRRPVPVGPPPGQPPLETVDPAASALPVPSRPPPTSEAEAPAERPSTAPVPVRSGGPTPAAKRAAQAGAGRGDGLRPAESAGLAFAATAPSPGRRSSRRPSDPSSPAAPGPRRTRPGAPAPVAAPSAGGGGGEVRPTDEPRRPGRPAPRPQDRPIIVLKPKPPGPS